MLTALPTSDGDRLQQLDLDLVTVPVDDVLAGPGDAGLSLSGYAAALLVRALQCVDMVGGAGAALDRTVAHTRGREQFGRPIASFQAAQHLVADIHIAVQVLDCPPAARSSGTGAAGPHCARPRSRCCRRPAAYRRATLDGHQLHGGMGYVVETDLHLWSERARLLGTLGGGPDVAGRWLEEADGRGCPIRPGPLRGARAGPLALGRGEYATKLFADFGADVVKVEKPGEGSLTRRWGPFPDDVPGPRAQRALPAPQPTSAPSRST